MEAWRHKAMDYYRRGSLTQCRHSSIVLDMRICVGNLKGGAAKTTTSVRLALGLSRSGPALLVDCDPEQSQSFEWSERAEESWPHDRLTVIPVATRDLYKRVRPMLDNYAHVIFDTGAKNPEL